MKQYRISKMTKQGQVLSQRTLSAPSIEVAKESFACRSGMTLDTLLKSFALRVEIR